MIQDKQLLIMNYYKNTKKKVYLMKKNDEKKLQIVTKIEH